MFVAGIKGNALRFSLSQNHIRIFTQRRMFFHFLDHKRQPELLSSSKDKPSTRRHGSLQQASDQHPRFLKVDSVCRHQLSSKIQPTLLALNIFSWLEAPSLEAQT